MYGGPEVAGGVGPTVEGVKGLTEAGEGSEREIDWDWESVLGRIAKPTGGDGLL